MARVQWHAVIGPHESCWSSDTHTSPVVYGLVLQVQNRVGGHIVPHAHVLGRRQV
jgi:hypothetical protein